jgi:hypothetical protein
VLEEDASFAEIQVKIVAVLGLLALFAHQRVFCLGWPPACLHRPAGFQHATALHRRLGRKS